MDRITRRAILTTGGGFAAGALGRWFDRFCGVALAEKTVGSTAFHGDDVARIAKALAQQPYSLEPFKLAAPFDNLTYDQYRDIRYRYEQSIWRKGKIDYELQIFPMGWLYDFLVDIFVVENGNPRRLLSDERIFTFGSLIGKVPDRGTFGASGFRIHSSINRPDRLDEFMVFQGASYFRGVARGQTYGLSGRGLAVNTGQTGGEEFPVFRSFWIERPEAGAAEIIVHALLDSASVTGAYRFIIRHGLPTVMDVDCELFLRRDLRHVGIAPLTSMFLFGNRNRLTSRDFRPAVHDSEGLAIHNGNGEHIWRPLANPKRLQTSIFIDKDPKGFGLIQRERRFSSYEDLEGKYHSRPSLWVEPRGNWGPGSIDLVELPTETEVNDNIVAFWRPAQGLKKDGQHRFSYRLSWMYDIHKEWQGAYVRKTRIGDARVGDKTKPGVVLFVIDFSGAAVRVPLDSIEIDLSGTVGELSAPSLQHNDHVKGIRVAFTLNPGGAKASELRLVLRSNGKAISEVWLYRWTRA